MTLYCDWCDKPIHDVVEKGWGMQIRFAPFHSMALGRNMAHEASKPKNIATDIHLHPKPCADEFVWAVRDLLDDRQPEDTDEPEDDPRRARDENQAAWRAWAQLPRPEKERQLLEMLGDDRLTITELAERFDDAHPSAEYSRSIRMQVWNQHIRNVLRRLLEAREVDRKPEPRVPRGKAIRYRWFRRRVLEGPIADLDRAFREEAG